jgi:metal-responsive CopG/Arc/MetJ family transcriptional regulator
MPDTLRVQLDLPERQVAELDGLMKETGVATRKDFFNQALSLLIWAIKEKREGRIIASVDEAHKHYREVVMPALNISSKSNA